MDLSKYLENYKEQSKVRMPDLNDLVGELSNHGLQVDHLDTSGNLVRVRVGEGLGSKADRSNQRSGWYVVNELSGNYFATFGNWKTGFEGKWSSIDTSTLSPVDTAKLKQQMAEAQHRLEEAKKNRNEEVATEVKELFASYKNTTEHKYLTNKKVKSYGLKTDPNSGLVVPVHNITGDIRSLQIIDKKGNKKFYPGGEIKGNMFCLGFSVDELPQIKELIVVEGYATAATVYEATKIPTACVFSANFGMRAVKNIRGVSQCKIYIALDSDTSSVGQRNAQDIANAYPNCFKRIPSITGDYNDMYLEHGLERVAKEIITSSLGITRFSIKNYKGEPPKREFLVDKFLEKGKPSIFAGIGGVGKSMLALDLALKVTRGHGTWFGHPIIKSGNVVYISAEDDQHEIHRRIMALDPEQKRYDTLHDTFAYTIPDTEQPMILLKDNKDGLHITEQANELVDELGKINDLALVILDPIQAMSAAPLSSSNEAAQLYGQLCASISSQLGASVMSIHHMSKAALSHTDDPMLARSYIRGATALVDSARQAFGLWLAKEQEAERICIDEGVEFDPLRVVRGGVVKSNSSEIDTTVKTLFRRGAVLEPYEENKFNFEDY